MPSQTPQQWKSYTHKFIAKGVQTASPGDLKPEGYYRRMVNARVRQAGTVQPRPGLDNWTLNQVAGDINSLRKITEQAGLSFLAIGTTSTVGIATQTTGITATDTGYSGLPKSFVMWTPELQADAWVYIFDKNRQRKKTHELNTTGINAYTRIGIVPPRGTPVADGPYVLTPQAKPTVAVGAAGGGTGIYQYVYRYRSSVTGVRSNTSDLSDQITLNNEAANLSDIKTSPDPQVDKIDIFRIGGTLTVLTFVDEISNGTTTYIDTKTDLAIAANDVLETFELDMPWVLRGTDGVIRGGNPLGRVWGPFNGFLLAVGDVNNPGNLYWSNGNDPDSTDRANFLKVTDGADPLVNGLIYDTRAFVFSYDKLFAIYPKIAALTAFEPLPTACKRGLAAPWAFAVGPEIYFLARDGIFATVGGPERSLTDDIYNLFTHEGAVDEPAVVDGMVPVNMKGLPLNADAYRLEYAHGFLYFTYIGIDGNGHHLIYDFATGGWSRDAYTGVPVRLYYAMEGEKQTLGVEPTSAHQDILLATTDGKLLVFAHGFRDLGSTFQMEVFPAFDDDGDPRTQKVWGDFIFEADPADLTVSITPRFDNGSISEVASTITGGPGRKKKIIDINSGNGILARNFAAEVIVQVTSDNATREGPFIYAWHPSYTDKPDETVRRAIEWHKPAEGVADAYVWGVELWIDTEGLDVTFEVHADQAFTGVTFTVNTTGEQRKRFDWTATPVKASLIKMIPQAANANPWRLTNWQWLSEDEPPRVPDFDTNWKPPLGDCDVAYVTGIKIEFDSFNLAKTFVIQTELEGVITLRTAYEGNVHTHNGRLTKTLTFTPFRAQQFRIHTEDGNLVQIYDICPIAYKEPNALDNFDATFEDWGRPHIVKGLEIYADTLGQDKTVNVELNGVVYQTLTVNHNGRQAKTYPLNLDTVNEVDDFPKASFVRLIAVDVDDAFFYRVRWLNEPEPDLIKNWDTAWVNLGDNHIIKGVRVEADTLGLAKTVQVQLDKMVVATLTVNHAGRKGFDYDLPLQGNGEYPRGQVVRLLPTDANPGRLYSWKPISEPEPPKLANWNPIWNKFGRPGLKFCQGIRVTADTEGVAKQILVEYDGGQTVGPFTINHALRDTTPISFDQPFLAHNLRIRGTDANPRWLYDVELISEPAPDLGTVWETQETSHDLSGFQHLRDSYFALVSFATVTLTVTIDGVAQPAYSIPSTAGAYRKIYLPFIANKGKIYKYRLQSPQGFRVFKRDCEVRAKQWGSEGAYQVFQPFGDYHREDGARL